MKGKSQPLALAGAEDEESPNANPTKQRERNRPLLVPLRARERREDVLFPPGQRAQIILLEAVETEHTPPVPWDEAGPGDYDAGVVLEGLLAHLDWSRRGDGLEREWFWSRYKWLKRHHPRPAHSVRSAIGEREDPAREEAGAALLIIGAVANWLDLDEDETQNLALIFLDKIEGRPSSNPWRRVTIRKVA